MPKMELIINIKSDSISQLKRDVEFLELLTDSARNAIYNIEKQKDLKYFRMIMSDEYKYIVEVKPIKETGI